MTQLVSFFLILLVGVMFSELFRKLHLPWVAALIIGGMLAGPWAFGLVSVDSTIEFFGEIGLIFLMFMAGLETKWKDIKGEAKEIGLLTIINSALPFLTGFVIGLSFDYSVTASLLIGIIFISSSVAVVIPSLESNGLLHTSLGRSMIASSLLQDVISLLLISVVLQSAERTAIIPLPLFYLLATLLFVFLRIVIPKVNRRLSRNQNDTKDLFQKELRVVLTILVGTVISFQILGLHPIIGGFFAGLILSDSVSSKILLEKIRTLSYGIFIPIFFFIVGAKTDLSVFVDIHTIVPLVAVVVAGSMASKYISGFLGARFSGFDNNDSQLIASSALPQLSTTLAGTFIAFDKGLIDGPITTSLVILTVVTTFIAPLLMSWFTKQRALSSAA